MAKTLIGNIKGPKGDKGAQGATGPQGTAGATGTRGSRWSEGTAITGTSTTATIFSGTGITDALVNDHYMNTSTGNVYRCTVAGNASTAKWVYVGNIKGPKGDKGDTGATGATGATGVQGEKGEKGDPGETPVLISSYTDMMANKVEGYAPDALAVKEGFEEVNSNLSVIDSKLLTAGIAKGIRIGFSDLSADKQFSMRMFVDNNNYYQLIFSQDGLTFQSVVNGVSTDIWGK